LSYQVLARKWRPQDFDDVAGQEHVTRALRNAIRQDRVPHAILLCGPRGVGKTTIARIVARGLNCEKGPTDQPCGTCVSCREIAAGTSTDVQEIDAASRTSVDDVRDLIEAVRYAPTPGKRRIYVVDEVHMLSTPAFNALLKTLEEPPPHSLFIFATTNPEKIPFTVLSRCQRHDLRRLPSSEIARRLAEVARAEDVAISERSVAEIAREGDGSLRDSLTLLDQIVAAGGAEVDDARVAEILDLIDRRILLAIAEACVDGDAAAALEACGRAAEAGIEAKRLADGLLATLRDLVVLAVAPAAEGLVEASDAEREALTALVGRTDATRLRRMFRGLLKELEDLTWAPQPFAVLEMAVVRLATLAPGTDVQQLLARLETWEANLRDDPGGSHGGPAGGAPRGGRSPDRSPTATRASGKRPAAKRPPEGRDAGATPATEIRTEIRAETDAAGTGSELFERLCSFVVQEDRGLGAALQAGRLVEREGAQLRIAVSEPFAAHRLERRRVDLESLLERFFAAPTRLEVIGPERVTQVGEPRDEQERRARLRREALDHPTVNRTLEILGGEVLEIRPLGGVVGRGDQP